MAPHVITRYYEGSLRPCAREEVLPGTSGWRGQAVSDRPSRPAYEDARVGVRGGATRDMRFRARTAAAGVVCDARSVVNAIVDRPPPRRRGGPSVPVPRLRGHPHGRTGGPRLD